MEIVVNTPLAGIDSELRGGPSGDWGPAFDEPGLPARARLQSEPADRPELHYSAESFTQAVRPLAGVMVTVARRILGDEVQAWDAVQEALIALWNEGEIPPNPRAWLTRAVVLRSLHLARSRARRRRYERRACERRLEASSRDDPAKPMEYDDLVHTVEQTLRTIPSEYRDVLLLRTDADMEYAAIAELLEIPIGTVRSRLNRTRQAFREALSWEIVPKRGSDPRYANGCS